MLEKAIGDEKWKKKEQLKKLFLKVKEVAEDAKDAVEGAIEGVKTCLSGDNK